MLEHESRTLTAEEMAEYWHDVRAALPVVSIEDGMDEEDWEGWKALTEKIGDLCQLVGRRPLRHQPRAAAARDRAGRRQLDPDQGQPDRHAHRDARGDPDRPRRRLHDRDLPPLRRDRGHDDRRPRGRHRSGPDQDRRPIALGPGREVQPPAADRGGARRPGEVPGRLSLRALGLPSMRLARADGESGAMPARRVRRRSGPSRIRWDRRRADRARSRALRRAGLLPEPAGEPAGGLAGVQVERGAARPAQAREDRARRSSSTRPPARPRSSARRAAWAW